MRIVVTGAYGRLGGVVCDKVASAGHDLFAFGRAELDITRVEQVTEVMHDLRPDVVINCVGYNAVDAAERDRAATFAANARGPELLALAADAAGAVFVHFSSDFVFDGEATRAYTETDPTNPLSIYGASKLTGEVATRRAARHYVLRISSLFGGVAIHGHRATVDYIADSLSSGASVRAAVDRTVTPSYAPDVVGAVVAMIDGDVPYGTYHCVSGPSTTWYELAVEVARQIGVTASIEPVRAAELPAVAPRPRFCALSNQKLAAVGITMPPWQSAIRRHLAARSAPVTVGRNSS